MKLPEQNGYSEKDLKDAEEFRANIHREALEKIRKIEPAIESVIDHNSIYDYFSYRWDYPGEWYLMVSIPEKFKSRDELVYSIITDTIDYYHRRKR